MKIWGIRVSFDCERSCSSPRRVSNFNSKEPLIGIYLHMKFEGERLNMFGILGILGPISGGIPFEMFLWRMLERKKQYKFRKLRLCHQSG